MKLVSLVVWVITRPVAFGCTASLIAPSLCAQRALLRIDEFSGSSELGASLASAGDMNGGGRDDLLVGAPGAAEVRIHFGEGGSQTLSGPSGSRFGDTLAGLSDLDGDAVREFAVGATTFGGGGRVQVFRGGVYSVRWTADASNAGDRFGAALARFLDLDSDGLDDVLIGAPQDPSRAGYVRICSGANGSAISTLNGSAPNDRLGAALVGLGDVNGDGVPDFAVGAPGALAARGQVTVRSGASLTALLTFLGGAAGDEYGYALADVGDLDLDGFGDLAIGAPRPAGGGGYVELRSGATGALLSTVSGDSGLGASLAGVGDYDADCYPDWIVGSPNFGGSGNDRGEARLYSGGDGRVLARLGGFFNNGGFPPQPASSLGRSVAGIGDFNGDGKPDAAVGGPFESHFEFGLMGHVVAFGDRGDVLEVRDAAFTGGFGRSVRFVGDLDADGADDLAVSAPVRVISGASGAVLLSLTGSGPVARAGDVDLDGTPDVLVLGSPTRVYSGASGATLLTLPFSSAGDGGRDLNGDGTSDLLLSNGAGALVVSGANGSTIHTIAALSPSTSPVTGAKNVAFLRDIDGDSVADFVVGDTGYVDNLNSSLGRVRVFSGANATLLGEVSNTDIGALGVAVCDAGDFNGDGVGDFAVSAEETSSFAIQTSGYVQVWSGATFTSLYHSGVQTLSNWGVRPARAFGFDVRGVGDFNGNGFDDIAISAPSEYGNGYNQWATGVVSVIGGPAGSVLRTSSGFEGYDLHGWSIDGGGDVDGDGFSDLAIGIPTDASNGDGATTTGARVVVERSLVAAAAGTNFCVAAPNSQWNDGAHISYAGSTSLARNDLRLRVDKAPVGQSGLFFMGTSTAQLPFGAGWMCIGGPKRRFGPPQLTSAPLGSLERAVDLAASPANAITVGSTWNFQFFFRDGGVSNLSDGLSLVFRP